MNMILVEINKNHSSPKYSIFSLKSLILKRYMVYDMKRYMVNDIYGSELTHQTSRRIDS